MFSLYNSDLIFCFLFFFFYRISYFSYLVIPFPRSSYSTFRISFSVFRFPFSAFRFPSDDWATLYSQQGESRFDRAWKFKKLKTSCAFLHDSDSLIGSIMIYELQVVIGNDKEFSFFSPFDVINNRFLRTRETQEEFFERKCDNEPNYLSRNKCNERAANYFHNITNIERIIF